MNLASMPSLLSGRAAVPEPRARGRCQRYAFAAALALLVPCAAAQSFEGAWVQLPGGTFVMGEPASAYEGPPGTYDAPEHAVTLGPFRLSATEVTNAQYAAFLNAAEVAGLVEVAEGTERPDVGALLVVGTAAAPASYRGQALVNLSGTRVLKDHDDADGDGDPFTGSVEPENPLNLSYLGYDSEEALGARFSVRDPHALDWHALTDYYDYTSTPRQLDTSALLNDFDAWDALAAIPGTLPTQAAVAEWPATFIRWYGAQAFADFYGVSLPTEAEWEYAARGGAEFTYATADGTLRGDGTSANWNHSAAVVAPAHVFSATWGEPNPYGLYNMAGNAWEWCADGYAPDFYADATDPVNAADTGLRVRRGGSWNYHSATLKSAARAYDEPLKGNDHFGFRVAERGLTSAAERPASSPRSWVGAPYPNPARPDASIPVYLAAPAHVRLSVADALGREVVRASHLLPAGTHVLRVGMPSGAAAGVYLARVEAAGQVGVRAFAVAR